MVKKTNAKHKIIINNEFNSIKNSIETISIKGNLV